MKKKLSINSLTREELGKYIFDLGEKKYRAKQLWKWLYVNGVKSFNEMSDISVKLRDKLNSELLFNRLSIDQHQVSKDGTQKWLLELKDNRKIETVEIKKIN